MRYISPLTGTLLLCVALLGCNEDRQQIRIVGSSTVYPFVTTAAEMFGAGGKWRTPIVESTGTGGGFKLFCGGAGDDTPDINNASRRIKESEVELCRENGVEGITEFTIGYDGIVMAAAKKGTPVPLTKHDIFLALAKQVPKDGALVENPYINWSDINPALPDTRIEVYGPPPTSGTRDAFVELVMEEACGEFSEFEATYPDKKERASRCHLLREDGHYIDAGEDDNLIIQKLQHNESAFGVVGYGFMEENHDKVHGSPIDGIVPNTQTIENGEYTVSRSLHVYVKNAHLKRTPGLAEFLRELVSDAAIGEDGYLILKGLLPLPAEIQTQEQTKAAGL